MTLAMKLLLALLVLGTIVWEQTKPATPNLCQKRYDVAGQGIAWQCQGGTVSILLTSLVKRPATLQIDRASRVWVYRDGMEAPPNTPKSGGDIIKSGTPLHLLPFARVVVYVYSSAPRYEMTLAWGTPLGG